MIVLDIRDMLGLTKCYANLHSAFCSIDEQMLAHIVCTLIPSHLPNTVTDTLPIYILVTDLGNVFSEANRLCDDNVIYDYVSDIEDLLFKHIDRFGGLHDQRTFKGDISGRLLTLQSTER